MPKKIDVAVSSLIDLKAELFRKQGEFLKKKTNNSINSDELYVKNKKSVFNDKFKVKKDEKSAGKQSEKVKILEEAVLEEERQLKKSKERLTQKSALYEKLSKSGAPNETDDDGNLLYLVNFEQKLNNEKISDDDEDDDVIPGPSYREEPANHEDQWVEYTDSFGRSRRCMRKDLPKFKEADKSSTNQKSWSETSQMLSKDMKQEIERRNWEEEEGDVKTALRGPVHYQQVLKNEAWEHGVSYFQFSTDESERNKQMKVLDEFRQQTIEQRSRNEKIKEKRKIQMKNRLEKVKERKKLKLDTDEILMSSDDDEELIGPNLNEIPLPSGSDTVKKSDAGVDSQAKKVSYVRPWDVGKPKFSQEAWVDKQREERSEEFAPPSSYYF